MKKFIGLFIIILLSVGLFSTANIQKRIKKYSGKNAKALIEFIVLVRG